MTVLSGKVAIVTGGSRGIGAAAATTLAHAGASVMILARDGDAAAEIADRIEDRGGQGLWCCLRRCGLCRGGGGGRSDCPAFRTTRHSDQQRRRDRTDRSAGRK